MPTPSPSEAPAPRDLGSPESAYDPEIMNSFQVLSSDIGRWLAITVLAAQPNARLSFWEVSKIIDTAQGDTPGFLLTQSTSNTIRHTFENTFAPGGLVSSEIVGEYAGWQTAGYQITERGIVAASVAGMLIEMQLRHPDKDISAMFRAREARLSSIGMLMAIADRSLTDFVPASFMGDTTSAYDCIDYLAAAGVIDKLSRGKDHRIFELRERKIPYDPDRASDVVKALYLVVTELQKTNITSVTGTQLLSEVNSMFPDIDLAAVWHRVTDKRPPSFLVSKPHPAFSKPTDKVAIRINKAYTSFVDELRTNLQALSSSGDAQNKARQYAQDILNDNPEAVAYLMGRGFLSEPTPYQGVVPSPDYEGWRADWPTHLRPTRRLLSSPELDMARMITAYFPPRRRRRSPGQAQ